MYNLLQRATIKGTFAQNVASTFGVQVVTLVLTVTNSAIIARWLGAEGKGILTLALLLPGMLALFLSGGINLANVYYAGSSRLSIPALTSNSVTFALLSTSLGLVLAGGLVATGWLASLLPGVPLQIALLGLLTLPLNLLNSNLLGILQGLQQILTTNLINLAQRALVVLTTLLLVVSLSLGLTGAATAPVIATAGSLIATVLLLKRQGASFKPRWRRPVMRATLSFGLMGYVANVLQFFNYRLDMFVVNFYLGPAGVGIYGVSVALAEMLWYLPNAVGYVIFPKAAATKSSEMNAFTPRAFRITFGLTALGALGLAVLAKPFILIVYTSAFDAAYAPLLALLPGVVLLGGAKVLTNEIAGRGYPHYNSIASGSALILTLILDLLLIPRHGVLGAAIASSVAYATVFAIAVLFYRKVSRKAAGVLDRSDA